MRFSSLFTMLMLIFTVGAPLIFLFLARRNPKDPDATNSKYEVFSTDSETNAGTMSAEYQTGNRTDTKQHWTHSVNTTWVWITLGVGIVWVVIMFGMYIAGFNSHAMQATH